MRTMLFGELMEAEETAEVLQEFLTYDQLFRMSDPKRFDRSANVQVPPMEVESYQTKHHWIFSYFFNAKSKPGFSTTGLRHRGYVRFRKPKRSQGGKNTPLSKLPVEVDCMCPDYRYRWAWANHQKRAGPIGKGSFNQCINKAPRKTNPTGKPGLCKHILATRDYIYGMLSGFPDTVGPTDRLDRLTKHATKRWLNFDADMAKARERDAKIAASKARRNIGLPPEDQNKPLTDVDLDMPLELPEITPEEPVVPAKPVDKLVEPPAAKPKKPVVPEKPASKGKIAAKAPPAAKKVAPTGDIKGLTPGQFIGRRFMKVEAVDSMTNMKTLTLQEARKLVTEMEDELGEMPPPSGTDMPIEPPMSDSAVGASTQDNVALGLLGEIRDLLAELVSTEAAESDEVPEIPEEELEPGEGEMEDDLGGGEEYRPGKRPMPVTNGAE